MHEGCVRTPFQLRIASVLSCTICTVLHIKKLNCTKPPLYKTPVHKTLRKSNRGDRRVAALGHRPARRATVHARRFVPGMPARIPRRALLGIPTQEGIPAPETRFPSIRFNEGRKTKGIARPLETKKYVKEWFWHCECL